MKASWEHLYDRVKDRRYGTFFFIAFFLSIGLLIGWSRLEEESRIWVIRVLPLFIFPTGMWFIQLIRRKLARQRERLRFPQLSGDELRVARSKLMKERDRKSV